MSDVAAHASYGEVLRGNRNFRRLWAGTVVSLFGDWFNTIALFAMVRDLTGSPLAVGLVDALKLSGYAAATIPGGILADRLDRRTLMIAADLLRAVLVCGFMLVHTASDVPLLYVLIVAQIALGAVFDPAYRALLPNIVSTRELMPANTLLSATWSTILAVGASIGGLVSSKLGYDAVFIINAGSYVFSALSIFGIRMPAVEAPASVAATVGGDGARRRRLRPTYLALVAYGDLRDGVRYLFGHRNVLRLACAKTAWALGGAALVYFLTQLGPRLEPTDAAFGIGILYSARGLGTGIGPFAARRWFQDMRRWAVIGGLAVSVSGVAYLVLGVVPWSYSMVVWIIIAHAASGANWVLSTVLLQALVPDRLRGRVFAAELLMLAIVEALVILAAAALLDGGALDLRTGIIVFAALQIVAGLAYAWWIRRDVDFATTVAEGSTSDR
ncbi:MAG: MFS transporter [Myxococcota bacterium]